MNTRENSDERISALLDGEAGEAEIELALAALRSEEGRARWAEYHRVGDALRSDDLACEPGAGFMAAFSARLEAEPTIIAPAALPARAAQAQAAQSLQMTHASRLRRLAMPGAAVAAAVAVIAFVVPQQIALQENPAGLVASAGGMGTTPASALTLASTQSPVPSRMRIVSDGKTQMLRDPVVDQYLLAHQRVSPAMSPSFYSATQFARPAPVEVVVDK